jgi:hypothetical protein
MRELKVILFVFATSVTVSFSCVVVPGSCSTNPSASCVRRLR